VLALLQEPLLALVSVAFLAAAVTGCATATQQSATGVTLAVWYDVEPMLASLSYDQANSETSTDFETMRRLGFNTILLRHGDEQANQALMSAGQGVGLTVAGESGPARHFVRTGELPDGFRSVRSLARSIARQSQGKAVLVAAGIGAEARARSTALSALIEDSDVTAWPVQAAILVDDLALIRVSARSPTLPHDRRSERWLGRFHAELMAGRTRGVVFDRFRRAPGYGDGLATESGTLSSRETAAAKSILERARRWCPRLLSTDVTTIEPSGKNPTGLRLAAYSHKKNRYVMIFNNSTDEFIRTEVAIPGRLSGRPVARAVEVPVEGEVAGEVVNAHAAGLKIDVDLRPGDARLYEIY